MQLPPKPPLKPNPCPHCGAEFGTSSLCPQCGFRIGAVLKRRFLTTFALFVLLGIPLLGIGTCSVVMLPGEIAPALHGGTGDPLMILGYSAAMGLAVGLWLLVATILAYRRYREGVRKDDETATSD